VTGIVDFRTSLLDQNDAPINALNPLPTTGGGGSPVEVYALNDLDGTDPLYIGKVTSDGVWLVQRYGTAAGTMRYANLSNNEDYTTYAEAWAARAGLTYGLFQTLTGV
jgi:hypothetical protein